MTLVGQPIRAQIRHNHTGARDKFNSIGAATKDTAISSSNKSQTSENGSLLRLLDTASRQSALGDKGQPAQNATDSTATELSGINIKPGAAVVAQAAVKTAIDTDSSGIQAADSAIASDSSGLIAAKAAMKENLTQLASDPKAFHETMQRSFGDSYNQVKAEAIREQVLNGDFDWMPDIKVVDESVLQEQSGTQGAGQGLGAYSKDNDTIYISTQLLESDPDKALQILTEEVGHGLDARLNTTDAAGDEGDIFARLVGGEEISEAELNDLRSENDNGIIMVDGKEVEVEFGWFSKAKKKLKKAVKKVTNTVKKVVNKVTDVVKDSVKAIKKGFKKVMQSELLGKIMMVAQFIPIPVVQLVVRGYNIAKAGYATYQGIKHGSIAMVLGGAAGVVGNVGKFGEILGASSGFVNKAANISTKLSTASAAYTAISEKDFGAAAGLASNFFGGADTKTGQAFAIAENAAETVENVENKDWLGAVQSGSATYSGFTDLRSEIRHPDGATEKTDPVKTTAESTSTAETEEPSKFQQTLGRINKEVGRAKENLADLKQWADDNKTTLDIVQAAVKRGDFSEAASIFLENHGERLGIPESQHSGLVAVAHVAEAYQFREAVREGNFEEAIGGAAGLIGQPLTSEVQSRVDTALKIRTAVLANDYPAASRAAASLAFQTGDIVSAGNFLSLANQLEGKLPIPFEEQTVFPQGSTAAEETSVAA